MIVFVDIVVRLSESTLEKFRRFVNEKHGFPRGVPYGTTISEELKEAHSMLNMNRDGTIGFELKPDGNIVPVSMDINGEKYKIVIEG